MNNIVSTATVQPQQATTFISSTKPNKKANKKEEKALLTFRVSTINEAFERAKESLLTKKNIMGDLIVQNDLIILFGRSNTGKSFFAFQVAEAIAQGTNVFNVVNPFNNTSITTQDYNLDNECEAQSIDYFDFEGTENNMFRRYTAKDNTNTFSFSENVKIAFPEFLDSPDNTDFIDAIKFTNSQTKSKVVIIDNLSAISNGDNEKAGNAAKLMNKIKDFQRSNNLTVIVLAHTPKVIEGQPIIGNNLAGSANIYNLADSVFAINTTSSDKNIRYLKQLKSRYSEIIYDSDNVITMNFFDRYDGLKGFEFLNYENELAMIKIIEKTVKEEENERIIELVKLLNMNYVAVAKELHIQYAKDVSLKTYTERIKKRIQKLKQKGLINVELDPAKLDPAKLDPAKLDPAKLDPTIIEPMEKNKSDFDFDSFTVKELEELLEKEEKEERKKNFLKMYPNAPQKIIDIWK